VLSLHPQSPAAETLYPKADSVNASDVPQKDTNAENDAIVANLATMFVFEFIDQFHKENKL
jgi:hypothetical protein